MAPVGHLSVFGLYIMLISPVGRFLFYSAVDGVGITRPGYLLFLSPLSIPSVIIRRPAYHNQHSPYPLSDPILSISIGPQPPTSDRYRDSVTSGSHSTSTVHILYRAIIHIQHNWRYGVAIRRPSVLPCLILFLLWFGPHVHGTHAFDLI